MLRVGSVVYDDNVADMGVFNADLFAYLSQFVHGKEASFSDMFSCILAMMATSGESLLSVIRNTYVSEDQFDSYDNCYIQCGFLSEWMADGMLIRAQVEQYDATMSSVEVLDSNEYNNGAEVEYNEFEVGDVEHDDLVVDTTDVPSISVIEGRFGRTGSYIINEDSDLNCLVESARRAGVHDIRCYGWLSSCAQFFMNNTCRYGVKFKRCNNYKQLVFFEYDFSMLTVVTQWDRFCRYMQINNYEDVASDLYSPMVSRAIFFRGYCYPFYRDCSHRWWYRKIDHCCDVRYVHHSGIDSNGYWTRDDEDGDYGGGT